MYLGKGEGVHTGTKRTNPMKERSLLHGVLPVYWVQVRLGLVAYLLLPVKPFADGVGNYPSQGRKQKDDEIHIVTPPPLLPVWRGSNDFILTHCYSQC